MNTNDRAAASAARAELEGLEALSDKAAKRLYSLLADYLTVVRQQLQPLLLQAVFQVSTQQLPEAFNSLSEQQRQAFRQRLSELCSRCSCLLTVEQLAQLALRLEASAATDQQESAEESLPLEPDGDGEAAEARAIEPLPDTEISLSLEPPRLMGDFDPNQFCAGPERRSSNATESEAALESTASDEQALDLLRQMVRGAVLAMPDQQQAPTEAFPLPREPRALMQWFQRWDRALQRRLRNLSHAVNVELLRAGLCRSLIPLTLLDAALSGQAELQAAPPNVLSVQMPLLDPSTAQELQLHGVLLRVAEFEHLRPDLRQIRSELHRLEATMLKMERRIRHWQKRLAVLQAQSLWLEDSSNDPSPQH